MKYVIKTISECFRTIKSLAWYKESENPTAAKDSCPCNSWILKSIPFTFTDIPSVVWIKDMHSIAYKHQTSSHLLNCLLYNLKGSALLSPIMSFQGCRPCRIKTSMQLRACHFCGSLRSQEISPKAHFLKQLLSLLSWA